MEENQNNTPVNPEPKPSGDKSFGPIIGIIIIIIMLVIGALYFWGNALNKQTQKNIAPTTEATTSDQTSI